MGSDADEFRFHFVGLSELVKTLGNRLRKHKNKGRDSNNYQGDYLRLVGIAISDEISANHRRDIEYAQHQKNKAGALP